MNDSENDHFVFAPRVKDCVVCTHLDPVWELDGDSGDEHIVYYCEVKAFGKYSYAKPTKRVICDTFEMI